jgi:hypothetical protein
VEHPSFWRLVQGTSRAQHERAAQNIEFVLLNAPNREFVPLNQRQRDKTGRHPFG